MTEPEVWLAHHVVAYGCGLAVLGMGTAVLLRWGRVLWANAPRNTGRLRHSRRRKDGTRTMRVVFRDRPRLVRGRDSEWHLVKTGERCDADFEAWLCSEWTRLEGKRAKRLAAKCRTRLVRPPELALRGDDSPVVDSIPEADDLLDELEAEMPALESDQQSDDDENQDDDSDEPRITEATWVM